MRKTMIRNSLLMLLVTALFAGALMLYLRSASPVISGEAATGDRYTASAEGFCSDVVVTASYADGVLTDLTIDASGETPAIGGAAAEALTTAILAAGGTSGVDAVASATLTSDAVFAALADCAAQAGVVSDEAEEADEADEAVEEITPIEELTVTPGASVTVASAPGYAGDVTVTLECDEDGTPLSVSIDASGETAQIGGVAAEELAAAIVTAGNAYSVDAVAGATMTSNAILAATRYIQEAVVLSNCVLYQASATGYSSDVVVTAGYKDGALVWMQVDASGETPKVGGVTAGEVAAEILAAGSADDVAIDAYAGSTITADAVLEAFAACEAQVG